MGKLLVIYDLMQYSVKIGNETERQSNSIVIRNGRNGDVSNTCREPTMYWEHDICGFISSPHYQCAASLIYLMLSNKVPHNLLAEKQLFYLIS